jgi:hypothetical protein
VVNYKVELGSAILVLNAGSFNIHVFHLCIVQECKYHAKYTLTCTGLKYLSEIMNFIENSAAVISPLIPECSEPILE